MILKYVGAEDYLGPNFIAQPGDLVDFEDGVGKEKLEKESELWEAGDTHGTSRKGRRSVRSD